MLWFSSYVIVFEFSWKVKEKKIGGITYWLTLVSLNFMIIELWSWCHFPRTLVSLLYIRYSIHIGMRAVIIPYHSLPRSRVMSDKFNYLKSHLGCNPIHFVRGTFFFSNSRCNKSDLGPLHLEKKMNWTHYGLILQNFGLKDFTVF